MNSEITISTAQAARALKVSQSHVRWLVRDGKLSAKREDGRVRLNALEVSVFAETYKPDRRRQLARASKGELPGPTVARVLELLRNPLANVDDIAIGARCSVERVCLLARFRGMSVEAATVLLDEDKANAESHRERKEQEKREAKEAWRRRVEREHEDVRLAAARADGVKR